jgi:hypothetical protein
MPNSEILAAIIAEARRKIVEARGNTRLLVDFADYPVRIPECWTVAYCLGELVPDHARR